MCQDSYLNPLLTARETDAKEITLALYVIYIVLLLQFFVVMDNLMKGLLVK